MKPYSVDGCPYLLFNPDNELLIKIIVGDLILIDGCGFYKVLHVHHDCIGVEAE